MTSTTPLTTRAKSLFARHRGRGAHRRLVRLVQDSPLRPMDARIKLVWALLLTPAVMLPLNRIIIYYVMFIGLLTYGRLLGEAAHQVRRLFWLLVILFILDWIFISLSFAVLITLRLTLLLGFSALLLGTMPTDELRDGLRGLGLPYRYAFVLSLAFQSLPLVMDEWRNIVEAQRARGAWRSYQGWRELPAYTLDMVALAVPAVVLTTRRAWSLTEAAHARGFDSPYKPELPRLRLRWHELAIVVGTLGGLLALGLLN